MVKDYQKMAIVIATMIHQWSALIAIAKLVYVPLVLYVEIKLVEGADQLTILPLEMRMMKTPMMISVNIATIIVVELAKHIVIVGH